MNPILLSIHDPRDACGIDPTLDETFALEQKQCLTTIDAAIRAQIDVSLSEMMSQGQKQIILQHITMDNKTSMCDCYIALENSPSLLESVCQPLTAALVGFSTLNAMREIEKKM
tara:strand:- start:469 stop:810 length:342 start_codon:yes stop_codon:yes gene_type:complete